MIGSRVYCPWIASLVASAAFAAAPNPKVIDDPAYTRPQKMVEIESGRRLNLYCTGSGSPTVVLDSGLGGDTSAWALVQPVVAAHTQVCSYDRAGLGFSDPQQRPGTSANIVDDLHRLLVAASIKPPYILVGHSYGGMNVRLYADLHLDEVAGMVLVDPTEEDWFVSAWKLDPRQRTIEQFHAELEGGWDEHRECVQQAAKSFVEGSKLYTRCVGDPDPRYSAEINAAWVQQNRSVSYQQAVLTEEESVRGGSDEQLRAARRWYGNMPLIVLASRTTKLRSDEKSEHRAALNRIHDYLDDQMAALSTHGLVRVVPDSTHDIQMSQPDAVSGAILEVLQEAAAGR
ncbi:MAG: alpha/beta hydrolase [Rudaea sp.]|nr:alpha/beta hydrolase [Rudaea sp.]